VTGPALKYAGEFAKTAGRALDRTGGGNPPPKVDLKAGERDGPIEAGKKFKPQPTPASSANPDKKAPAPGNTTKPAKMSTGAGAASNRDLPGKTTITYASKTTAPAASTDKPANYGTSTNKPPTRDLASLQARSRASAEEAKRAGAARSGAAERSRRMNRNK
jgi:hypothetical protein